MSEAAHALALLGLLGDSTVQTILSLTSAEPMSAKELDRDCSASLPTIYRRLDQLKQQELISTERRPNPNGNDYEVFRARLETVTISLQDGEFSVETAQTDNPPQRFAELWEQMRE